MLEPKLVIADEITSALDVSGQADVIKLLESMRGTVDSAMLFIFHNLAVVQQVCDEIVVMGQGRIVEQGPVESVYRNPSHSYTAKLLASVPASLGFTLDYSQSMTQRQWPVRRRNPVPVRAGCPAAAIT